MSYARKGLKSDVYIIEGDGYLQCFCTSPAFLCETHEEMILHLGIHKRLGERVPISAVVELWNDIPVIKEVVEE